MIETGIALFESTEATDKLDEALAKAQGEIQVAEKNKQNPHFKSAYADLQAVWDACREALTKHGVSVSQWPLHSEDGRVHLITRLAHSGQWMRSRFSVPVAQQSPQAYVAAVTYLKRCGLSSAVGVAPGETDDDGNHATRGVSPSRPSEAVKPYSPPVEESHDGMSTVPQQKTIHMLAAKLGYDEDALRDILEKKSGKRSTKGLLSAEATVIIKALMAEVGKISGFEKGPARLKSLLPTGTEKEEGTWEDRGPEDA